MEPEMREAMMSLLRRKRDGSLEGFMNEKMESAARENGLTADGSVLLRMSFDAGFVAEAAFNATKGQTPHPHVIYATARDGSEWMIPPEDIHLKNVSTKSETLRRLFDKLGVFAYVRVAQIEVAAANTGMTVLEREAWIKDPANRSWAISISGETSDGAGTVQIMPITGDGISMPPAYILCGMRDRWPGPTTFAGHGIPEVWPMTEATGW